jgi:hypothetical protein
VNPERASIFSFRKIDQALLLHRTLLGERSFADRPKTRLIIRVVYDLRNLVGGVSNLAVE